ncbi:MAG: sugar ABC transporter permease [Peptoniphilaceae bacterium]|nr:sugar ABC transporter permease [Peptoniphilaceae bacterium]
MNSGILDKVKKNSMVFILLAVIVVFTILTGGNVLLPQNVNNIISQNAYVIVLAVGMLFCILTGGNIDLSVGSIVALVGSLAGVMIVKQHMNIYLSIAICLGVGLILGAIQGYLIAYIKAPSFIVTLAGMMAWRGLSLVILQGFTIAPFPDNYSRLFNSYLPSPKVGELDVICMVIGIAAVIAYIINALKNHRAEKKIAMEEKSDAAFAVETMLVVAGLLFVTYSLAKFRGFPVILILLAAIVFLYNYYASRTVNGRHYYAVGGNENAATLSGIDARHVYFKAYVNSGLLAAVAGLMVVARFNSATPTLGDGYEMDAIAAAYIGGASAYGGVGTVWQVVIGAVFMGVLNNGMSIMGIDADYQRIVKGVVLAVAVVFDIVSKRRNASE